MTVKEALTFDVDNFMSAYATTPTVAEGVVISIGADKRIKVRSSRFHEIAHRKHSEKGKKECSDLQIAFMDYINANRVISVMSKRIIMLPVPKEETGEFIKEVIDDAFEDFSASYADEIANSLVSVKDIKRPAGKVVIQLAKEMGWVLAI
jgi:hypothetical protein